MNEPVDMMSLRMQQLVEENRNLKSYICQMMQNLHDNELLLARLQPIEQLAMGAQSVASLCQNLQHEIRQSFQLDRVQFYFNRYGFIDSSCFHEEGARECRWLPEAGLRPFAYDMNWHDVVLMSKKTQDIFPLVAAGDDRMGSIALLPLKSSDNFLGVLMLGSLNMDHFDPEQGIDFLKRLACTIAWGLESVRHRELRMFTPIVNMLSMNHLHLNEPLSFWFGKGVAICCLYIQAKNDREQFEYSYQRELWLDQLQKILHQPLRIQDAMLNLGQMRYVIFLPATTQAEAEGVAEKLLHDVKKAYHEIVPHLSIGLSIALEAQLTSMHGLVDGAEQASYIAQALGGYRIELAEGHDAFE
ncbi:MAG: DUF484 family protein [Zetaproteobacteria bacterium]|nr:DUF484 family protein [Zetaproteobacteria bacterium]